MRSLPSTDAPGRLSRQVGFCSVGRALRLTHYSASHSSSTACLARRPPWKETEHNLLRCLVGKAHLLSILSRCRVWKRVTPGSRLPFCRSSQAHLFLVCRGRHPPTCVHTICSGTRRRARYSLPGVDLRLCIRSASCMRSNISPLRSWRSLMTSVGVCASCGWWCSACGGFAPCEPRKGSARSSSASWSKGVSREDAEVDVEDSEGWEEAGEGERGGEDGGRSSSGWGDGGGL